MSSDREAMSEKLSSIRKGVTTMSIHQGASPWKIHPSPQKGNHLLTPLSTRKRRSMKRIRKKEKKKRVTKGRKRRKKKKRKEREAVKKVT